LNFVFLKIIFQNLKIKLINLRYEDKNRKKRLSAAQEEQKLAHLERVSEEQKHRINVLEKTISDMQAINRLKCKK
jgi:hypothetical protein